MKPFNVFQLGLAISAVEANRAGFPAVSAAFAKVLRKDLGMAEATPDAPNPCHVSQTGGNRPFYGKFSLNEMDECTLGTVEQPERSRP